MKSLQKWSPIGLSTALIVGVFVGWMIAPQVGVPLSEAQEAELEHPLDLLPAADSPPPELQALVGPGEAELPELEANFTQEEVLEALRNLPVDGRPAADSPPPELQALVGLGEAELPELEQIEVPTVEELIEELRNLPGGEEMIEEARQRGAPIGMGAGESGFSLSWLDLFKIAEAEAQTPVLSLDAGNQWILGSSGITFWGAIINAHGPGSVILGARFQFPKLGNQVIRPFALLTFNAPQTAWYIINFIGEGGGKADLLHWNGTGYTTVQPLDYTGQPGLHNYPALVKLAAGTHFFVFVVDTDNVKVYQANVFSLP